MLIPSGVVATVDVRILPDESPDELLDRTRAVVNDPAILESELHRFARFYWDVVTGIAGRSSSKQAVPGRKP